MTAPTPWPQFLADFRWKQGEHVAAIAPTGAGKTTLLRQLMPYRKANIVFGTKIADPQYNHMINRLGYRRVERISEVRPWDHNVLLWPRQGNRTIPELVSAQQNAFREAMNTIVRQRAWTVWVDEAKYVAEFLKLKTELTFMVEQLRSINATVICGAQRPVFLPQSVLSNASHVFLWKTTHREDAAKLADMGGVDTKAVREEALTLGDHEMLYIRTRGTDAKVIRTQVSERKK